MVNAVRRKDYVFFWKSCGKNFEEVHGEFPLSVVPSFHLKRFRSVVAVQALLTLRIDEDEENEEDPQHDGRSAKVNKYKLQLLTADINFSVVAEGGYHTLFT